ncbi:MAG: hypothetical protein E7I83_06025 [Veillonella sp.]|nr:hypothetical protein [Veillonella sp.]
MNTMNCDQNCNLLDAKALGNWGEDIARQYIEQQGLKIVTTGAPWCHPWIATGGCFKT